MAFAFSRRRLARWLLAGLALPPLGACSSPAAQLVTQRRLQLSAAQLQAAPDARFPQHQRVAELLDVRLSAPRLKLLPTQGRLAAELQLDITERLLQSTHPARLALDFGLRFEPSDRTVRLQDVRVQQLVLTQLAPAHQALMNRYAPRLAERALDGQVLHQVSADDWATLQLLGLEPADFRVTADGLSLDFRAPGSAARPAPSR